MSGMEGALCRGKGKLFESTNPADHAQAKALCDVCPAIAACREWRKATAAAGTAAYGGPCGTWAGKLYGAGDRGRANPREHGTERGYQQHRHLKEPPCRACKTAHYEVLRDTFGVAI